MPGVRTQLTPEDRTKLAAAAEKATPGQRIVAGDGGQVFLVNGGKLLDCRTQWADDDDQHGQDADWERGNRNADYEALCSPERIASLLKALEEANADLSESEKDRAEMTEKWMAAESRAEAAEAQCAHVREALQSVMDWWSEVYPADVFTGVSGDDGALSVVALREKIIAALAPDSGTRLLERLRALEAVALAAKAWATDTCGKGHGAALRAEEGLRTAMDRWEKEAQR